MGRLAPPPFAKSSMGSRIRYAALAAWLLVSLAIVGCEDGRTRPPSVTVQVLHAAPERNTIEFIRGQRNEAQLEFRQASGPLVFDSDRYNFTIRALNSSGSAATSLGTFTRELQPNKQYLIAIAEVAGTVAPVVLEKDAFSGTTAEINMMHAAPTLGAMALYVEPDGVVPSAAAPVGTLGFGETLEPITRAPGTYRLSLTEAGQPTNVLMTSALFALEEARSYAFVIVDPAGDSHAAVTVALLGNDTSMLIDESVQSSVAIVNAAADGAPRDVFVDDDFSAPLLASAPPLVRSADLPLAPGAHKIGITPAGNTGVVEAENTTTYARSRFHVALIAGEPGDLEVLAAPDDRRRIAGESRITFMNAASQFESLEFFLVPPGTDISQLRSTIVLSAPSMTTRLAFPPGDYELYVRKVDAETLAGPAAVTLVSGGVYSALAINGAVAGTADFEYFEDFIQ